MAETHIKTTSSKGFNERAAHILTPHNGAVRKLEHEQVSREHKGFQHANEDWQTLVASKNKLKRKKKLSASLTSVGDTVNQEKRTRIEGIHLNIKSRAKDNNGTCEAANLAVGATANSPATAAKAAVKQPQTKVERPVIIGGVNVLSAAPQRFKRKLQENLDTIQKLNALAEQLRLEVNELKSSLITERGAVRALRAQNDADSRKWRNDVKKLQQTLETTKKCNGTKKPNELAAEASSHVAADGLINYEIQRLTNEIAVLKEANKTKEEKTQIIGQADRRKAADMRQLKTAYENRLTQIQKSAKIEITRLLEEIKTKERNIGQLKKDLQTLQNGKKPSEAKTKPKTNESSQKLKKPTTKTTTTKTITPTITIATKATNETDIKDMSTNTLHQAQVTNEITQLKNIELINNTKNVHKSTLEMRTGKTTKQQQQQQQQQQQHHEQMNHEQIILGGGSEGATTTMTTTWMETLLTSSAAATKPTTREYRTKDHNSDTDSALSSAPPSISPQPPSSGADSGVMWQALQDLDKLQKEVEIYHKENERLQAELQLMKQELLTAEKAALAASSSNAHINELLQRIKDMEEQQLQLNSDASELREQNELLEFRILELEDDKMDGTCEDHCQRLENLLRKSAQQLADKDKRCLQQLLLCVQQLDLDAMADQDSWQTTTKAEPRARHSRIVATVQPYSNSATPSAPTTPSKQQQQQRSGSSAWQNCSLSESGVFVECDISTSSTEAETHPLPHPQPQPHPHLVYYQERLVQLEGKLLIYESSGEQQAKHLAERLQRELQLNKQVKELIERVELLVEQNALLDEAKCEFEEAENDTRLHLQRNEEELEILRQRNVELEFGKDALGAKYRDCRAECLILREDLCAAETQLEHLQAERQRAKQQLESLRRSLPLLLICRLLALARLSNMGNEESLPQRPLAGASKAICRSAVMPKPNSNNSVDAGAAREISYLKDEVKTLRCKLQDVNTRHYEAMETADSHWVDLEREYKSREEAYRTKELCLKQKINKLQDCLRDDSRAANEKIQQLEETEQGLKTCLVRLTKEHRDLMERNRALELEMENRANADRLAAEQMQPLSEQLENEKRRNQTLMDDLSFAKKLQQSMEEQLKAETDCLRQQIYDLKKELMHIEVTNGELKEEVGTLEAKIAEMEKQLRACEERACCLEDELRTKDELVQRLERKLGVCPENFSLADELYDSPEKRAKRVEISDLQAASQGLGCALRDLERRERELPTHKDFQTIACSVKQLADTILHSQKPPVSECECEGARERPVSICKDKELRKSSEKGEKEEGDKKEEKEDAKKEEKEDDAKQEKDDDAKQEKDDDAKQEKEDDVKKEDEVKQEEEATVSPGTPPAEDADAAAADEERASGGAFVDRTAGGGLSGRDSLSLRHLGKKLKKQFCRLVYGKQSLAKPPLTAANLEQQQQLKEAARVDQARLSRRRRQCKRFVNRRIYRTRVRRSGATSRPIDMQLRHSCSVASFHSLATVHTMHTDRSLGTSRTQFVDILEPQWTRAQLNDWVQTEPISSQCQLVQASPQMCDEQLQTECSSQDCGIQADNVCVEARLQLLPSRTRAFLLLLQQSISEAADDGVAEFRARVLQLWEGSEEFREHIELLQDLCTEQTRARDSPELYESYDVFVAVLGCVRALKFALKPSCSHLLQQLEERINERLICFHNHKMESEFYCTIYYPVERQNPLKFGEDI